MRPGAATVPDTIRFVAQCVAPAHAGAATADAPPPPDLDWLAVVRYALDHKVLPLLEHGLRRLHAGQVPPALSAQLATTCGTFTQPNLALARALVEIDSALRSAGLRYLACKGPVLAVSAYQDLNRRQFADLDILVREPDLPRLRQLLAARGYTEIHKRIAWEASFRHDRVDLDVHWRLAPGEPFDYWLGFDFDHDGALARARSCTVLGAEIPCFAPEDAILAHCINALKGGFNRQLAELRWVCDIAAMARSYTDLDWDVLIERAAERGNRRALLLCLGVAQALLEAPVPERVGRMIAGDRVLRFLIERVIGRFFSVLDLQSISIAEQYLYAALLKERWRDALPCWRRCLAGVLAPTEQDRAFVRLPEWAGWAYVVLRPIRLVIERRRGSAPPPSRERGQG